MGLPAQRTTLNVERTREKLDLQAFLMILMGISNLITKVQKNFLLLIRDRLRDVRNQVGSITSRAPPPNYTRERQKSSLGPGRFILSCKLFLMILMGISNLITKVQKIFLLLKDFYHSYFIKAIIDHSFYGFTSAKNTMNVGRTREKLVNHEQSVGIYRLC